uniref:Myosin IXA n=1 Tax=Denticeps clupeoides TaxID=299321 RepID=A0AAY4CPH3_9TELE
MSAYDIWGRRRFEDHDFMLRVYPGTISEGTIYCPVSARKATSAAEVIEQVIERLRLDRTKCYVLAEVKEFGGEEWILNPSDCPVQRMMLWPRMALENRSGGEDYRFLLREKNLDGSIHYGSLQMWLQVTEERRRMVERGFLPQPPPKDYNDLCNLPDLNEKTLLDNLRSRFKQEKIYTYVGSILIVINPFKFLPIYNPKYVKMYDNHHLGKLEPHIYAVADVAYHAMLQRRRDQCIVISGESGSGKTQSTNFLIHHLTALSQKGFASGVEQTILGAGPVLEAFGNAKTAHNNNSSRFGKFIQVNYQESGTVRGAYVEKYLLEKSRLVYQEHNERNYHVFYYLLAGAREEERKEFHLIKPEEYHYLNQVATVMYCLKTQDCFSVEGEDLKHDFERLQLAMEMVGFLPATRKKIFSLLSAILHLGNIQYKKKTYRDDSIDICNPEVLPTVSELLEVKEEMLFEALTTRKTVTVGEKLIVPYKLAEAVAVRDSMAKSLYSALFDWIVFRINHALLNNRDLEEMTKILSIGVLDIFGFEDYEINSFEQFCINFANERLQHYFNQHIFKLEQEEYRAEGISWHNIDYTDNSGCILLISKKPTGLLHLLDEECNFPQATNQTLLDKFKRQHEGSSYIEFPAVMEPAFIIRHYAGKVKYRVKDFREKNTDHMRPDIVALLKSSRKAFIVSLIGIHPVATFRWAVLRAYFRAVVAFRLAGKRFKEKRSGHVDWAVHTVLNTVDSFSFLQHPVHQRSLEILQRCKEENHSVCRRNSRTPLSDLQGSNTLNERPPRNGSAHMPPAASRGEEDGIFINPTSSKLLERAHGILINPGFRLFDLVCSLQHLLDVKSLKYLSNLTLHDRITKSLLHLHKKKKPPSISAQFQASLNKLMETLDQSEPYFVKCIRSNADKLPVRFSDGLVLRQLRYTGMLETVRIRQSGYSIKYSFQEFARHFRVLLAEGTRGTQESIQSFLCQTNLKTGGFQVGHSMVFLHEAERQRLQDLLHQEVVRRIVALQRRFRASLQRRRYLRMRQAACLIQQWWRVCLLSLSHDAAVQQRAAVCLQAAWRGYRERRQLLLRRDAVLLIQMCWRRYCQRRRAAAGIIQASWRGHRLRQSYLRLCQSALLIQSMARGYLVRQRFREQRLKEFKLLNGQTGASLEEEVETAKTPESDEKTPQSATLPLVVVRERTRTLDQDSNQKTRAKRESRRIRELEQAKFSLELLKVRSSSAASPSEERRWSAESSGLHSPQATLDSHSSKGSFELPNTEEDRPSVPTDILPFPSSGPVDEPEVYPLSPQSSLHHETVLPHVPSKSPAEAEPASPPPVIAKMEHYLPTFYIPPVQTQTNELPSPTVSHIKNQQQTLLLNRLEKLNQELLECQMNQQQQQEQQMMQQIRQQKHILERERKHLAQSEREMFEKKRGEALQKIEKSRLTARQEPPEGGNHQRLATYQSWAPTAEPQMSRGLTVREVCRVLTSSHLIYFLKIVILCLFLFIFLLLPLRPLDVHFGLNIAEGQLLFSIFLVNQVTMPGHRKKARMARTRSDFLTRVQTTQGEAESEQDESANAPLSPSSLLAEPEAATEAGHSDSDLVMSWPSRTQRKMRFWNRTKQGEKKSHRERLICDTLEWDYADAGDGETAGTLFLSGEYLSPPHSPDQTLERGQEFKENKEPSPKVKRRRSVKISSVALEPGQWQNDSLQILTCTNDYCSMNEFLMKKINDLDTEDGKKDTVVDVVFKRALKEFRLNIFNSYTTALAMDDGKSIRYKDLYALFEQILEKNMRVEQRDWSESPVGVWVNTFKVFLDEFMTEYKPLHSTLSRVPKTERKKRNKKDSDIVEELNGHVFKSTQYSIPTYCEFCSSLIWMMDKACVCKLCRYACHRKCCAKTNTKCSKKFDAELSSRQFGVDVSRLTSDERLVPLVVEKLINYIEMHGLYTEGIYRKSGSTNKVKELKQALDTDVDNVNLDDFNIHVIASVFKQWLRDLPNPLMSFELYEDFLRALGLQDRKEAVRAVYGIIDQLSRTHLNTLERLIFHLVRIALQVETNRMSANALAIVFAPCILRCPDTTDPLLSVQDISKTTACVELIIAEQMIKYKTRLKDISSLEFAENKAKSRLTLIRRSMVRTFPKSGKGHMSRTSYHGPSPPVSPRLPMEDASGEREEQQQQQAAMQREERVLTEQIESLQKEKEDLTFEMLSLEPQASDDETLESEASIGTADSSENLNLDSEGRGASLSKARPSRSDVRSRRTLRRQQDSLDSADSASTGSSQLHPASSSSTSTGRRFRFRSRGNSSLDAGELEYEEHAQFISRGTFSAVKGRQKLRDARMPPPANSSSRHKTEPDLSPQRQHLVLYGSNEFMV